MGFVIFPILSNDPEAIFLSIKDKADLSLALTLDRCLQTALLIISLLVMIAWGVQGDGMSLDFDGFPVAVTFASIIVVTYVVE